MLRRIFPIFSTIKVTRPCSDKDRVSRRRNRNDNDERERELQHSRSKWLRLHRQTWDLYRPSTVRPNIHRRHNRKRYPGADIRPAQTDEKRAQHLHTQSCPRRSVGDHQLRAVHVYRLHGKRLKSVCHTYMAIGDIKIRTDSNEPLKIWRSKVKLKCLYSVRVVISRDSRLLYSLPQQAWDSLSCALARFHRRHYPIL